MAYRGDTKHYRKSIVNSVLGLVYIILVAPKGIYDILQIARVVSYKALPVEKDNTQIILHLVATLVVISNPVIYSFVTPR